MQRDFAEKFAGKGEALIAKDNRSERHDMKEFRDRRIRREECPAMLRPRER